MTIRPVRVAEAVRGPLSPAQAIRSAQPAGARQLVGGELPGVEVLVEPTQVRRPWRAMLRTFVQTIIPAIIALGVVVPEVVDVILDEAGEQLPDGFRAALLAISAAVAAVAAIVARIMALPSVERLLRVLPLLNRLAAAPAPEQDDTAL